MTLLIIGVMITLAGAAAILQTRRITQAHTLLNHIAVPQLDRARLSERKVTDLLEVLARLDQAQSAEELSRLRDAATLRAEDVAQTIQMLRLADVPQDILDAMLARLAAANDTSARIIDLKLALYDMRAKERALSSDLQRLHDKTARAMEALKFRNTAEFEELSKSVSDLRDNGSEIIGRLSSDLLFRALAINDASLKLETIFDKIRDAQTYAGTQDNGVLQDDLLRRLYDLAITLSQMPASPERAELALLVQDLRPVLKGKDSLFVRLSADLALEQALQTARVARTDLNGQMVQTTSQLVSQAISEMTRASERLNAAVVQLSVILAVAFLLALMVTAAALYWVVERQINRRMQRLNREVGDTADGAFETPITVSGKDELGDMARALGVFQQNARELQRSNVELEKFAYVAAHDLRSPVRAIRDLALWAQEDPDSTYSAESTAYMTLLLARAERLRQLLDDLLDYARAGQNTLVASDVDLPQLIQQLIIEADPEQRFRFKCDIPDGTVHTYASPLEQIVGNLIRNAVKHHDRDQGLIEIVIRPEADRLRISVRDDGPGIAPAYHAKVFELFKTLRPRDEVEGSGQGLAIVSKLAERFGGEVTLHSDPDKARGARFDLCMPLVNAISHHETQIGGRAA